MNEDQLLRELADLAKEENAAEEVRLDARWDRLAAGTLSAEEDAELRALAAASPAAREAYEAFRPLGDGFQARLVDRLAAELADSPAAEEPRSRVLRFPVRRAGWLSAVAAAAAVLLLLLRSPMPLAPLPVYRPELSGGVKTYRGEAGPATGAQVFAPGSSLTLAVRPEHRVTGDLEGQVFLARGADVVPWHPAALLAFSAGGVARLKGTIGQEIPLPPGRWRLWIVVARRGQLPPAGELAAKLRAGTTRDDHWQAVPADLKIEAQAPP